MTKRHTVYIDAEMESLVDEFLTNINEDVAIMREALRRDDLLRVETLGHQMKGSGTSYGFEVVSAIGKSIEQSAKEKSSEDLTALMNELEDYLKNVEVVADE